MPYDIIKNPDDSYKVILKSTGQILSKKTKEPYKQIKAIEISKKERENETGRKNPKLWQLAEKIAFQKFNNKHSARMRQYQGKVYRDLGGEYTDDLKPNQLSMKKWTNEEWGRDIPEGRYLPKKIREKLKPKEYLETSIKKIEDTKKGIQYSKQPDKIIEKIKELKGGKKKIGKYTYFLSDKPNKKLKVMVNDKWVYFGHPSYEHYYDKTGLLPKELNHLDDKRRELYLKRSRKIKNKKGELTANNPESANYHSINILW